MTKQDYLELLMLLSALESWSFSFADRQRLPDWLQENLDNSIDKLKAEILKDQPRSFAADLRLQSECRGDKL